MNKNDRSSRRTFLGQASLGGAAALAADAEARQGKPSTVAGKYARVCSGRQLKMIAFPLGGVGAGSLSLGGRGQLRDWEIFNRPDKGHNLAYALPSIWVRAEGERPMARVLEARYQPPYEGQDGLGAENAPGLSRLASATFTGEYPLAKIQFQDKELPVQVELEAFSPFIPHEPDDSGLPIALLRYRVRNSSLKACQVSIAWSIDNPVGTGEARRNDYRLGGGLSGLMMTNPGVAASDVMHGSFAVAILQPGDGKVTYLRGWPRGRWWNSPLLFWDDFSSDGELGPESAQVNGVGSVCLSRGIAAGTDAEYSFLLGWHFPNRTPAHCGWKAPAGLENTVIGNWYATRFPDAWAVVDYAGIRMPELERKTRLFANSLRESTLPAAVLEAASANLSTLASTTCFRTADGEFHGFEGVDDKSGCCFGNCTHVWNYETATAHLFPTFARSLRKAAFGFSMDDAGAMQFRQLLPDGKERSGFAAADGQMGQIVHVYLDWALSGDRGWLQNLWPRVKKAIEFAWVAGGWDANRDGVMEGVQHNTYDVEFYGPNPQCGIYYLAALRAGEEMAKVVGDAAFAQECRRLFESGSRWVDENLFNGEYFTQQVQPYRNDQIAPSLRSSMGADDPEHPEYQVGKGCLVDQLVGQYLADVCGLGPLVSEDHIQKTLRSIYRYNYKRGLYDHDSVQRTFALNDESALVICDYGSKPRPKIPFPYFAEVMTGFEYSTAAHMLFAGMTEQGVECISNIRARYDGERRNPWDEAECGHHYARAMAAWSGVLALSGFRYQAGRLEIAPKMAPKMSLPEFKCFWSTGTGWGSFTRNAKRTQVAVLHGSLMVESYSAAATGDGGRVTYKARTVPHTTTREGERVLFAFEQQLVVAEGETITFEI